MINEAPQWWWAQQGTGLPVHLWPAWPVLLGVEACYKGIIAARNRAYDRRRQAGSLFEPPIPTISVGNISVGGSGKTPLTIWLAGMLRMKGRHPAIIARGYGAKSSQLNDELELAARKCPYAVVLANPDRANAIRDAVTFHGADAAILDDSFQHRKVRRDLDIVLVDATRGLGNGHMLPAGPLREPIQSLSRADVVLLTRAEQVGPADLEALRRQIASQVRRDLPIGQVAFQHAGLSHLDLTAADLPEGAGGAFAGIGNFAAFEGTCRHNGLEVVARMALSDHVGYEESLCDRIARWAEASRVSWLVTTEKDAVKLARIERAWPVPIYVLAIRVVPDERTRSLLETKVDSLLKGR